MSYKHGKPGGYGTGFRTGDFSTGKYRYAGYNDGRRDFGTSRLGEAVREVAPKLLKYLPLIVPLLFLLYGTLYDEEYPQLDFGPIICAPDVAPIDVTFVFDDSGSLWRNDPHHRRYEEAREVTQWWTTEGCHPDDQVAVLHFDDVVPPLAPSPVRSTDPVSSFRRAGGSSSVIAPSLGTAMTWSQMREGEDVVVIFTDGYNPDAQAGINALAQHPAAEVVFVSLGGSPPSPWQASNLDNVVVLDNQPPLGAVGYSISEVIRTNAEATDA